MEQTHYPPVAGAFAPQIRTVQVTSDTTPSDNARNYYMEHAGNAIGINVDGDGNETSDPSAIRTSYIVHFLAVGSGSNIAGRAAGKGVCGYARITNPHIIKAFEQRRERIIAAGGKPDIMTAEEYELHALPADVVVAKLRQRAEAAEKALEATQNRLAADVNKGVGGLAQAGAQQAQPQNQARR